MLTPPSRDIPIDTFLPVFFFPHYAKNMESLEWLLDRGWGKATVKTSLILPLFFSVFLGPRQEAKLNPSRVFTKNPQDLPPGPSLASGRSLEGAAERPHAEGTRRETRINLGTAAARRWRPQHGGPARCPRPYL